MERFFYDCEAGYVPDSGEELVNDGSTEDYPLDWGCPVPEDMPGDLGPCPQGAPGP